MEATKNITETTKRREISAGNYERKVTRVNEDFDTMKFTMNSSTEAMEFMRSFPPNMPSTHRLKYDWIKTPKGAHVLTFSLEPIGVNGSPVIASPATDERKALEALSKPDLLDRAAQAGVDLPANTGKAALIAAILEAKKEPAAASGE